MDYSALPEGVPDFGTTGYSHLPEGTPDFGTKPPPARMSFAQAFGQGMDQFQGMQYGAVEAAGEATGSDYLKSFGKEGRQRNTAEAASYGVPMEFSDISGVGDTLQYIKETVGRQIPMVAGGVAGAAIGTALAPAGAVAGVTAGTLGATIGGLTTGIGEVQGVIKDRGEEYSAPGAAFLGGAGIAALDSILPGKYGSMLVKKLGPEVAANLVSKSWKQAAIKDAGIEGFTEALQEYVGDYAAAVGTDTPMSKDIHHQAFEAGMAGGLLGGLVGGGHHAVTQGLGTTHDTDTQATGIPIVDETAQEADLAGVVADGQDAINAITDRKPVGTVDLTPPPGSVPLPTADVVAGVDTSLAGAEEYTLNNKIGLPQEDVVISGIVGREPFKATFAGVTEDGERNIYKPDGGGAEIHLDAENAKRLRIKVESAVPVVNQPEQVVPADQTVPVSPVPSDEQLTATPRMPDAEPARQLAEPIKQPETPIAAPPTEPSIMAPPVEEVATQGEPEVVTPPVGVVEQAVSDGMKPTTPDITKKDGKPYATEKSAWLANKALQETHEAVPVDGGFVLRERSAQISAPTTEVTKEPTVPVTDQRGSVQTKQEALRAKMVKKEETGVVKKEWAPPTLTETLHSEVGFLTGNANNTGDPSLYNKVLKAAKDKPDLADFREFLQVFKRKVNSNAKLVDYDTRKMRAFEIEALDALDDATKQQYVDLISNIIRHADNLTGYIGLGLTPKDAANAAAGGTGGKSGARTARDFADVVNAEVGGQPIEGEVVREGTPPTLVLPKQEALKAKMVEKAVIPVTTPEKHATLPPGETLTLGEKTMAKAKGVVYGRDMSRYEAAKEAHVAAENASAEAMAEEKLAEAAWEKTRSDADLTAKHEASAKRMAAWKAVDKAKSDLYDALPGNGAYSTQDGERFYAQADKDSVRGLLLDATLLAPTEAEVKKGNTSTMISLHIGKARFEIRNTKERIEAFGKNIVPAVPKRLHGTVPSGPMPRAEYLDRPYNRTALRPTDIQFVNPEGKVGVDLRPGEVGRVINDNNLREVLAANPLYEAIGPTKVKGTPLWRYVLRFQGVQIPEQKPSSTPAIQRPADIAQANGKPFDKVSVALNTLKMQKLEDTHSVTQLDAGGFVLRPNEPTGTKKETVVAPPVTAKPVVGNETPETTPQTPLSGIPAYGVYPVGKRWAVRQQGNAGTEEVLGDTLHGSREEAIKESEFRKKADANDKIRKEKDEAEKASMAASRAAIKDDDINGFLVGQGSLQSGKIRNDLNSRLRFAEDGIMSKRERVEMLHQRGDLNIEVTDEPAIKPLSRNAFHRASNEEQRAHDLKMKQAGTKKLYTVNDSDLGKTAYDYARHLLGKKQTPLQGENATPTIKSQLIAAEAKMREASAAHDAALESGLDHRIRETSKALIASTKAVNHLKTVAKIAEKRGVSAQMPESGLGTSTTDAEASLADLHALLEKIIPGNRVALRLTDVVRGDDTTTIGTYYDRLIEVATYAEDKVATVSHEAIHALRDLGVIRGMEWRKLTNFVKGHRELMANVRERWDTDLSEEQILEEAVGEYYAKWRKLDPIQAYADTFVGKAMERINKFFYAFGTWLDSKGYTRLSDISMAISDTAKTPEHILQDIENGVTGSRPGYDTYPTTTVSNAKAPISKAQASTIVRDNGRVVDDVRITGERQKFVRSMNLFSSFFAMPRMVATMRKAFAPVYDVGNSQRKVIETHRAEMITMIKPFMALRGESLRKVSAVLELGAILKKDWTVNKPFMDTEGDLAFSTEDPKIVLTDEEFVAYRSVRDTFNHAYDKLVYTWLTSPKMMKLLSNPEHPAMAYNLHADQRQALPDLGDIIDSADARIAKLREGGVEGVDQTKAIEELTMLKDTAAELLFKVDQAKRQGYIPFSRFGEVSVTAYDVDGGVLHSELIETKGLKGLLNRAMDGTVLESMPEVAAARDRIREQYKGRVKELKIFQVRDEFAPGKEGKKVVKTDLDVLFEFEKKKPEAGDTRGFTRHLLERFDVPGYSTDFPRVFSDYVLGAGGFLGRLEHVDQWDDAITAIPENDHTLEQYANEYRTYVNSPHEELRALRQIGFIAYISGRVSTALVNLTQMPVVTLPYLNALSTPKSSMQFMKAFGEAAGMIQFSSTAEWMKLDWHKFDGEPGLKKAMHEAFNEGSLAAQDLYDAMAMAYDRSKNTRGLREGIQRTTQALGAVFSTTEQVNRVATFIAAYRMAETDPEGVKAQAEKVLGANSLAQIQVLGPHFSPKTFATWVVDETHFVSGKYNRAVMQRGLGTAITQFKSFPLNVLHLEKRMLFNMGREGKVAFTLHLTAIGITAGAMGLPGGQDLSDLIDYLSEQFSGIPRDIKTEAMEMMVEMGASPRIADLIMHGAFRELEVDMNRVGLGNILPNSLVEAGGIPVALAKRVEKFTTHLAKGETQKAIGDLTPAFITDMITAGLWGSDGIRNASGKMVLPADKITQFDVALKAVGFTTAHIARMQEKRRAETLAEQAHSALQQRYSTLITRAQAVLANKMSSVSQKTDAKRQLADIQRQVQEYNVGKTRDQLLNPRPRASSLQRELGLKPKEPTYLDKIYLE